VLDGRLIETRMPSVIQSRFALGPRGRLELGDDEHPVTATLRRLEMAPEPIGIVDAPLIRTMWLPGVPVGAGRRVVDYEGTDRAYGRFTVSHPGTGPIDQNTVPGLNAIARDDVITPARQDELREAVEVG
ncbi:MAG TPA: hypothetical protein VFS32_05985, partial [Candidatus Limnocylindrales bacterium]|nr:hypothetical protein [Candidatus Limnocylindrales bacterium]